MTEKVNLPTFVKKNPFPQPLTTGFFYREKMRAIHRISPSSGLAEILEIGGGQSGLTTLLYPQAEVVNLDKDADYAEAACNQQSNVRFVCGDATALPFPDCSFDGVTMFDVVEHVEDDERAISEALRVLRPGGFLLLSTPNENWRFPYYKFMQPICPAEANVMNGWGHVRRGYSLERLQQLVGFSCADYATFINPRTSLAHDLTFSRLPKPLKVLSCAAIAPLTVLGYLDHHPHDPGTETAVAWKKPAI